MMLIQIVFLVFLLYISDSKEEIQCPPGQYLANDTCQKCGPCFAIWQAKINPLKKDSLDFRELEKMINDIEHRLINNKEKVAMLKKTKTGLLSQLKRVQSIELTVRKDIDNTEASNNIRAKRINADEEKLRILEDDINKLKKETESKPATDNSGYFNQINKAKKDAVKAAEREKIAAKNIQDLQNGCNLTIDGDLSALKNRVNEEQSILSNLGMKFHDSFATMNSVIPCDNKICESNVTCRVCIDFQKCYDNNMFEMAGNIINRKYKALKEQVDNAKYNIPLFEYELDRIKNQKTQIKAVFDTTLSPEKKLLKIVKKYLGNSSIYDADLHKSILQLNLNKDDSEVKDSANKLKEIINKWSKMRSEDINDLRNKSEQLLDSSKSMIDNIQFIKETIIMVKDILKGKDDTNVEENLLKDFLLELAEIIDEIERHYEKVLNKKNRIEGKLDRLLQLNIRLEQIFDDIMNSLRIAKEESLEIINKVMNELSELTKKIDILSEIENRTSSIHIFSSRMNKLLIRSVDLVERIRKLDYSKETTYVINLNLIMEESLIEMETIFETIGNKSLVYEKCL